VAKRDPNGFYIYVLFRETGIPFYIGKGRGSRWGDHERTAVPGRSYKDNIICLMIAAGMEIPKIKVREGLTNKEAGEVEAALIKAIGRYPDGPLANLCAGGGGLLDPSPSTRELMSKAQRARDPSTFRTINHKLAGEKRRGVPRPPHVIEALRKAFAGKPLAPEHCQKLHLAHVGKPKSEAFKANLRGRKLTPEHKAKIGNSSRGRKYGPCPDDRKIKISQKLTGRKVGPLTKEHREKIKDTMTGRTYPEERRQAMRNGWDKWRAQNGKTDYRNGRKLKTKQQAAQLVLPIGAD
jgi:hypothetical protein